MRSFSRTVSLVAFSFPFPSSGVLAVLIVLGGVGLVGGLSGCGVLGEGGEGVVSTDQNFTVDRSGRDVTVLQAWVGDDVGRAYSNGYKTGRLQLDPGACKGTDCSGPAQKLFDSTLLGPFHYGADTSGICETLEIRTVIRDSALEASTFAGIGFYFARVGTTERGFRFVSRDTLAERGDSGHVTLKDGTGATVHRFVTQGMCFGLGGTGGSINNRAYQFKPYAQFDVASSDRQYRVWDSVPDDYVIGRRGTSFVTRFDRQDELLQK